MKKLILFLLASPLSAQSIPSVTIEYDSTIKTEAQTTCDLKTNDILVSVSPKLSPDELKLTLAHEMTHVGQVFAAGSCAYADSLYSGNVVFRYHAELDAYCEEARVEKLYSVKVTQPNALPFDLYMFVAYTQGFMSLQDTKKSIRELCPERVEDNTNG